MKKTVWAFLFSSLLLVGAMFSIPHMIETHADFGPKPALYIDFSGMEDQTYDVTTLCRWGTGPRMTVDSPEDMENPDAIDLKFVSYVDADGYKYLDVYQRIEGDGRFSYAYYPPSEFKILIYFEGLDSFCISASVYETYAFTSYYSVKMDANQISSITPGSDIELAPNDVVITYDYFTEIWHLAVRVLVTLAIEIGIAFIFMYYHKKQLKTIFITNVATQLALNIALSLFAYFYGVTFLFYPFFFFLELLIVIAEAIVYFLKFNRINDLDEKVPVGHPVLYALIANAFSCALGVIIAVLASTWFF